MLVHTTKIETLTSNFHKMVSVTISLSGISTDNVIYIFVSVAFLFLLLILYKNVFFLLESWCSYIVSSNFGCFFKKQHTVNLFWKHLV